MNKQLVHRNFYNKFRKKNIGFWSVAKGIWVEYFLFEKWPFNILFKNGWKCAWTKSCCHLSDNWVIKTQQLDLYQGVKFTLAS